MRLGWLPTIATVLSLGLTGILSCAQGTLDKQAQIVAGGGDSPEVRISAISPTAGSDLEMLTIAIEPAEGGHLVQVALDDELSDLSEMYLRIQYDPNLSHADRLQADAAESAGVIGLAVEAEPGVIECGVVAVNSNDSKTAALHAGDAVVSFLLVEGAGPRAVSSAATSNRARARNLELAQEDDERWTLSWDYTNPGDSNQDGMVGVTDLTQIGQHYLTQLDDSWTDPRRHIDGNRDGEINASDITAIGQNYNAEVYQYEIELFDEDADEYITVGTLRLADMEANAGQTVRFSYKFGPQYVANGWYRVSSLSRELERGAPSEEISESGRRLEGIEVPAGKRATVTVHASGLAYPIAHLNCVRVVYPASYSYVRDSANAGSVGGNRDASDGIWASFSPALLFPSETFFQEKDLGNGLKAVDLNVTTLVRDLPGAPVSHGDLINLQLESLNGEPLTLESMNSSSDGIKRTYYTDDAAQQRFFGNTLGFSLQ